MEKECECYEEEVQPYRKTDYKPIIYILIMKHIHHLISTLYLMRFIEIMRVTYRTYPPRRCKDMTSLVHQRNNRVSIKKQYLSNPFGNTTIEAGTRLVDRMMEKKEMGRSHYID